MSRYTYYWRDGKRSVLEGHDEADALNRAGYGGGAVAAIDFWCQGDNKDYTWNLRTREWDRNYSAVDVE